VISLIALVDTASAQRSKPPTDQGGRGTGTHGVHGNGGGGTGTDLGGLHDLGLGGTIYTGGSPVPDGATAGSQTSSEASLDYNIHAYIVGSGSQLIQSLPIVAKTRRVLG
jgi:hypothetical protein